MRPDASSSSWWRWLSGQLLRFGVWRVNAVLTLAAVVLAVGAAQLIVTLAGRGDSLLAGVAAGVSCALLAPWANAFMLRLLFELAQARDELALRATQDELTGVHNRRHFMDLAERELARCRRYQTAGALLLVDADHFKRINDSHGHVCGDALLCEITRVTLGSLRLADLLGRFGGEELIIFLPHTDPLGALDVADRIRERVSELRMPWQGREVHTTVSIGVAAVEPGHASLDALIHDADTALFAAKEAGRNCVRAAPIQPRRSGETHPVSAPRP
jgi:diguanylate cyclase (GGDEF)-like protein